MTRMIQVEHRAWLATRYPHQLPIEPAAGLVEESGELMRALLKCQQANGGKHPEPRYADADFNAMFVDAVGDCGLFACSLCNTMGWSFAKLIDDAKLCLPKVDTAFRMAAKLVGWASYVCEEPTQRGSLICYMSQLLRICEVWNIGFDDAIRETWEVVKCR